MFSEVFKDKEYENGMVYRFLPMLVNAPPPMFTEDDITEEDCDIWADLIDKMYAIPARVDPKTGFIDKKILVVEEEGKKLWAEFHNNLSELRIDMPYLFKGYIPKLLTYTLKFMSLLHLIKYYQKDELPLVVKKSTVRGAIEITRYFAGQAMQLSTGALKEQGFDTPDASEDQETLYINSLKDALNALKDEIKGGKLHYSRIREKVNETLPSSLAPLTPQNKKLGIWLNDIGLKSKVSGGNKKVIIWDDNINLS